MKSWKFYVLSVVLAFSLAGAGLQAATITKGLIGTQDINLTQTQAGAAETFGRSSSTGTTLTLNKLEGNSIPWSSAYTRTILPLHITGNGSTSALTDFLTGTFSGTVSAATATISGAATIGTTLQVTGAGTFLAALTSDSFTTGAGTFSGDIAANGNIVGDASTTATALALVSTAALDIDSKTFDTGTAIPTSGTYVVGDFIYNSTPAQDNTISATVALGWYCWAAGTPGSWIPIFPPIDQTPASAAAFGSKGMVAYDTSYIYVAVADNTWLRAGIATW